MTKIHSISSVFFPVDLNSFNGDPINQYVKVGENGALVKADNIYDDCIGVIIGIDVNLADVAVVFDVPLSDLWPPK